MRRPGFSVPYSAPENYTYVENKTTYSYKNDIFSLGVIMHELTTNNHPFFFSSQSTKRTVYGGSGGSRIDEYWFSCGEEVRQHG